MTMCERCSQAQAAYFTETYTPGDGIRTYWLCKACQIAVALAIQREVDG